MAESLNPWHALRPLPPGAQPTVSVTVVIPYHDALTELRLTLVALARQTYPASLVDVVVVDDGSREPLSASDVADVLPVTVINRPDEGFTLAAARNDGARLARGDVVAFLDCDMVPDPSWLQSHLRWHHGSAACLVLGMRDHVDTKGISEDALAQAMDGGGMSVLVADRTVERPEWIEFHLARTKDLTSADTDMFRVVTGGNLSVGRSFFEEVGGFDPSFRRWGGEDTEFGFRAWNAGALLVPDRDAHCWHQGLGITPDDSERVSQRIQGHKLAHLIPHPGFRPALPGRRWARPMVVAEVGSGEPDAVIETARALVAFDDIVVVVQDSSDPLVVEDLGPDPAVRLGQRVDDHPHVPFVVRVPAGLRPTPDQVAELLDRVVDVGAVTTPQGASATYRRRVALGRGEPSGVDTVFRVPRPPSPAGKVAARLSRIRSWDDAMGAARWASAAVGRRLGRTTRPTSAMAPGVPATMTDPWDRVELRGVPGLGDREPGERVDLVVLGERASAPDHAEVPVLRLPAGGPLAWLATPMLDTNAVAAVLALGAESDPRIDLRRLVEVPGPRTSVGLETPWPQADPLAAEALLESLRRAVLAEHLGEARRSALFRAASLPATLPSVSVVVSSRRPERLGSVLAALAGQTYDELEVVVIGHGVDVDEAVRRRLGGVPSSIIGVDGSVPFGAALQFGSRLASGDLILKVDDDDLYGPGHVEDLVLAAVLSNADLVGKGAEFVHLERQAVTIRRFVGGAWSRSTTIAGGALAVRRDVLNEIGGWRPVPRHVDKGLIEDVRSAGGNVFRTHAFGFVLVRHGDHTWASDDDRFLDQAESRWDGLPEAILSEWPADRRRPG